MCKAMEDMRNETAKESKIEAFAAAVTGIKKALGIDTDKAVEMANVPAELRAAVMAML